MNKCFRNIARSTMVRVSGMHDLHLFQYMCVRTLVYEDMKAVAGRAPAHVSQWVQHSGYLFAIATRM